MDYIFRGKTANGEWVYGSLVHSENIQPAIYFEVGKGSVKTFDFVFIKPETVGQYTGLKDCNGKMIFEGDIVKITDHTIEETFESCGALVTMLMTRTYEIFWNVTKWSIKSLEPMLAVDPPIFDLLTKNVTYEIIGNIHEEKA